MKKSLLCCLLVSVFALSGADISVPVLWSRKKVRDFQVKQAGFYADGENYIFSIVVKNLPEIAKTNGNIGIYWNCDGDRATGRFPKSQGVDVQANIAVGQNSVGLINWHSDKKRSNIVPLESGYRLLRKGDTLTLVMAKELFSKIRMSKGAEIRVFVYANKKRTDNILFKTGAPADNGSVIKVVTSFPTAANPAIGPGTIRVPVIWHSGDTTPGKLLMAGAYQDKDKYVFGFKVKGAGKLDACSIYWNSDGDSATGRFPKRQGVDLQLNVSLKNQRIKALLWPDGKDYNVMTVYEDDYHVEVVGDVIYIALRKQALERCKINQQSNFVVQYKLNGRGVRNLCRIDFEAPCEEFIEPVLNFTRFGALTSNRVKKSIAIPVARKAARAVVWDCGAERFNIKEPTPKFAPAVPALSLKAARGETGSLFFAIETKTDFSSLQVIPGTLSSGKNNLTPQVQSIQYADYISDDRNMLFTDILHDKFPGKKVKRQFVVWHVEIPRNAAAGTYRGTLKPVIDGKADAAIPVEVTVYDFSIPEVPAMRSAMSIKNGHISACFRNSAVVRAIYDEMVDRCRKFRIGPRLAGVEPKFALDKNGKLHIDWKIFDARAKYLFKEKKINALQLPPAQLGSHGKFYRWNSILKKHYKSTDDPEFQSVWKQFVRQYVDHMKTLDFADKMLFIVWDEPYGLEEPRKAAKMVREVAPELPIGIFIDRCDPSLKDCIDIWLVTLQTINQALNIAKANGQRVWLYNSNGMNNFRLPAADIRSFFYLADHHGIEGFLSSEINEISKSGVKDGVFFNHYPQHCQFYVSPDGKTVYDSWRLVLLRQGFNDYDYLAVYKGLLKSKNLPVPKWLTDAAPGFDDKGMPDFRIDTVAELDKLKERIAREIEKLQRSR